MAKIIVTGGAGFIGSHIVDALVGDGHEVHVVDNLSGGKKENVNKNATLHQVDINNLPVMFDIFKNTDCIFHQAALPSAPFSVDNPVESFQANASGTVQVLTAASRARVKRVVFASSSSIYGTPEQLPVVETMLPSPLSPYALQKYTGELHCCMWSNLYGLETVCLRYFNVYGPRQRSEGAYAPVIAKFIAARSRGEVLPIVGDGKQTRDFTHVFDVVRANLLAMTSEKVGKGEVINIGANGTTSILEIAHMIGGIVEHVPSRIEPLASQADITRAKELLGWEPKVPLREAVDELKREVGIA